MSKKLSFGTLFHRAPATAGSPTEEQTQEIERLDRELKTAKLETRFRESLADGKIDGDIITIDNSGNVVRKTQSTNIFDL